MQVLIKMLSNINVAKLQMQYMFVSFVWLMVFNATYISAISWRSALLLDETGGPGENHRPVASH
jgi:hypothetical protein